MERKNKLGKSERLEKKVRKKSDKVLDKRQVQLNLQSVPSSKNSAIISDKRPLKVQRTKSSDTEPHTYDLCDKLNLFKKVW